MEEFIPHHMDKKILRKYFVDTDSPRFQEEYEKAQALWKRAGNVGGLDDGFLFALALKYQKLIPTTSEAVAEEDATSVTYTLPPKKKLGRPKKKPVTA